MTGVGQEQKASRPNLMGGGDTAEVGHVLDGPDGEAAVDEAVVHEHVGHSEQRDPQPLRATQRRGTSDRLGQSRAGRRAERACTCLGLVAIARDSRNKRHERGRVREETPLNLFFLILFIYLVPVCTSALVFLLIGASMSLEVTTRRPPAVDVDADVWMRRRRGCENDVYYYATFHTPAACWVKF